MIIQNTEYNKLLISALMKCHYENEKLTKVVVRHEVSLCTTTFFPIFS